MDIDILLLVIALVILWLAIYAPRAQAASAIADWEFPLSLCAPAFFPIATSSYPWHRRNEDGLGAVMKAWAVSHLMIPTVIIPTIIVMALSVRGQQETDRGPPGSEAMPDARCPMPDARCPLLDALARCAKGTCP